VLYAAPDGNLIRWRIQNGVLHFYRERYLGQPSEVSVFQNTSAAVAANSGLRAQFELGNSSNVRKRITVLIHEGNFTDLHVCTFWLLPNTPLRPYLMRTYTNLTWTNATISIYASTADGLGDILLDNVSLHREMPSINRTLCDEPTAPPPGVGADGPNIIDNPSFTTAIPLVGGSAINAWLPFASPINALVWRQLNGVFEMYRSGDNNANALLMQSDPLQMPANVPVEITLQLGNSSNERMRVLLLLHQANFQDLHACTFWLNPNTPLSTYVIRTYATQPWTDGTVLSIYAATTGNGSGYTRVDNVSVRLRPSLNIVGTECYAPGALPADTTFSIDEPLAPIVPPTLAATASSTPEQAVTAPEMPVAPTALPSETEPVEGNQSEERGHDSFTQGSKVG
jgi:hypothetical protein